MAADLSPWLLPPKEEPGAILRWVRRVSVAVSALLLAAVALVWLSEGRVLWPVIVAVAVALVNAAVMGPAIRDADARGPVTAPDEVAEMRRRGDRIAAVAHGLMLIVAPVLAYVIYGSTAALVLFVAGLISAAIVLHTRRRATGPDSPPR